MAFWHHHRWEDHHGREIALKNEHSHKYLDVAESSHKNGAHVHQWEWLNAPNQHFELHYHHDDQSFAIKVTHSGKYLDVEDGEYESGAHVIQYDYTGKDNQRFYFEHQNDGSYSIRAKHSGMFLQIKHHGKHNGDRLVQGDWHHHHGSTLKWFLVPLTFDGKVAYISAHHSGKFLDVEHSSHHDGAKVHQWDKTGAENQMWRFKYHAADDTYTLINVHSGKVMDVEHGSRDVGAKIHQWHDSGADNQKWRLIKQHGHHHQGMFKLQSKHSGLFLDVEGPSKHDGAKVHQWEWLDSPSQQFKFHFI